MDVCLPNNFLISHTVNKSANNRWERNNDLPLAKPSHEPSWLGAEAWVALETAATPRDKRGKRSHHCTATAIDPCWQVI